MIGEVMDYCKNHFITDLESGYYVFDATGKTITGTFDTDYYVVGGYIYVKGSKLNDTAYTISAVTATEITVNETIYDESTTDKYTVYIYACSPPRSFLSLVTDITSWESDNSSLVGISSESIGKFSTSYGDGIKNGGGWQGAFYAKLSQFRKLTNDIGVAYGYY